MRLFYFLPRGGGYDELLHLDGEWFPFGSMSSDADRLNCWWLSSEGLESPGKIGAGEGIIESIGQADWPDRPIDFGRL